MESKLQGDGKYRCLYQESHVLLIFTIIPKEAMFDCFILHIFHDNNNMEKKKNNASFAMKLCQITIPRVHSPVDVKDSIWSQQWSNDH